MKKYLATGFAVVILSLGQSAYAESYITNQGGELQYACSSGELQGTNCVIPESTLVQTIYADPTMESKRIRTSVQHNCFTSWNPSWYQWYWDRGWEYEVIGPGCEGYSTTMAVDFYETQVQDVLTCPTDYLLVNNNCEKQVSQPVPAQTIEAQAVGTVGGSTVANVSGLFSPFINFIKDIFTSVIGLVVIITVIGIAIAAAVRRSKAIK